MGCSVARLVRLVDQAVDGESLVAVVGVVPFRAIAKGLVLRLGVWPSGDLGGSALLLPGLLRCVPAGSATRRQASHVLAGEHPTPLGHRVCVPRSCGRVFGEGLKDR